MNIRPSKAALSLLFALAAGASPLASSEQDTAPKGNKGFKAELKQAVELGPEISGMDGRQLRMRVLTIEPGGYIGVHSHKDRPSVLYTLKGTDTVTAADGAVKVLHPGDTAASGKDTTHWHINRGKEPVVLVLVDVFNEKNKEK